MDEDHPLWPQDAYGLSKAAGELIARSYSARGGLETVVLRPAPIKVPAQMDAMQRNNGDATIKFNLFNYVDIRDLAEAYRLAVERPAVGGVVLFLCADDSAVGEPLCTVFPRLMPATAALAAPLTGSRPSVLNTRAKGILGWQPRHSWRPPSTIY
jgi:nucleoside-diphosphate-sugar epimerase